MPRGVGIDRLRAQWDEIARVQERVKIKLLKGTESDILEDGSLDYPDSFLEQFDIIIASIHARHKMDSEQMTRAAVARAQIAVLQNLGPSARQIDPIAPALRLPHGRSAGRHRRVPLRHRSQRRSAPSRSGAALDSRGARARHQIHCLHRCSFDRRPGKFAVRRLHGAARLAHARTKFSTRSMPKISQAVHP